jgi:hypothetical protein
LNHSTNSVFNHYGVAVDSAGNLSIADSGNNRIRKVSRGVITTIARGGSSLDDNGPATSAQLNYPAGVANAASNLSSASISPGEIIVLCGSGLGPLQLMQAGGGVFATQIAGSSVAINGIPAPIVYTSASQNAALHQPVLDATGVAGKFDLKLETIRRRGTGGCG